MPSYPIEIAPFGSTSHDLIADIVADMNDLQSEIRFSLPRVEYAIWFERLDRDEYHTAYIWEKLKSYRDHAKGFHPFIIAVVRGFLQNDKTGNLFGSREDEAGLAVFTTHDWEEKFAPPPLPALVAYYLVRYTLSFICPTVQVHEETRGCFFDYKGYKHDIKHSMKQGRICPECRNTFEECVDGFTYAAISNLVEYVRNRSLETIRPRKPRMFIASSSEGLEIAYHLQMMLSNDFDAEVWNQGTVFGLGDGNLEALERAVNRYDLGVFVFSPDDQLHVRGEVHPVARDNVIFEAGLFIGKLSRRRAFIVHPSKRAISLPSDLLGTTNATYDPDAPNLAVALGPACLRITQAARNATRT